jgi:transcriptional regulator with XRE-family HTH domain
VAARKQPQISFDSLLAEVRASKGVNQHELARQTGMSLSSLKRLEHGEVANPPLWWFINCARALNVELEEILDPKLLAWRPGPNAAAGPPPPEWLTDRHERALLWAGSEDLGRPRTSERRPNSPPAASSP